MKILGYTYQILQDVNADALGASGRILDLSPLLAKSKVKK